MAKQLGTGATLFVNDGSGYVEVNNITNVSINPTTNESDCTDNDDAGYVSNLAGNSQVSLSCDCNYDEQAGQIDVIDAWDNKTSCTWRLRMETTAGKKNYVFTSYVFDMTATAPNGEVDTLSFSLNSNGAVTISTQ